MRKKLAIFDLDGTLYDTREVNFLSYQKALVEEGYVLEREFYRKECNGKFYKDYLPLLMGSPTKEQMKRVHNRKKELYPLCLETVIENKQLFSILSLIREEYYIALVTTASKQNCFDILRFFNRETEFDLILTQSDVKKKKPDPEGFILAMEYFNIEAAQTIIFEDSDIGIEAACSCGANVMKVMDFI